MEKITGGKLKRKGMPWGMFKLIGTVYPLLREAVKMNYLWFTPHSLDGSKLKAFLGEIENTAPEEAIAQALYDQNLWDKAPIANKMAA